MRFRLVLYTILAASLCFPFPAKGQVVSINFDDGYIDPLTTGAVARLEKEGFRATFYPHTNELGTPGHMTFQQLRLLASNGHEVSPHSVTHPDLTALPPVKMQTEILNSRNIFLLNGLRAYSFAYPFGAYNTLVISELKKAGFLFARGTDSDDQNNTTSNRWALMSESLTRLTSLAQIEIELQKTINEKSWFVMVIHEIKAQSDSDRLYTITPEFFNQMIDLIVEYRISVRTNRQAACAYFKTGCGPLIQ